MPGEPSNRGEDGSEARNGLEELPSILGDIVQSRQDLDENPSRRRRGRTADQLAQPPPATRFGAIHGRTDTSGPKPEQGFGGIAVVSRHQGDSRNGGELVNESRYRGQLNAAAAVNGDDERVNPLPPRGAQYVVKRIDMKGGKTAVSSRVQAGPFWRWEDCADGHHGGKG